MGKGNRNKLDRAKAQVDSPEAYLAERRKLNKKNKKNRTGLGVTITCIVLVSVIVLTLLIGALNATGVFARMTNTIQTENFTVTESMMQFFYNEYILNWVNNGTNQMYVMYGMIDFASDLRTQKCTIAESGTWYDYFMAGTIENVTMYLEYAEGAKAAGLSLDDEDYAEINDTVKAMKKALKETGESISDRYGDSVSATDVKNCYELIYLASKFNEAKMEQLEEAIRKDDAGILAYPESHKTDFYSAEYIAYTITVRSDDLKYMGKDEKIEAAKAEAKANADTIAAAKDSADFFEQIKAYLESVKEEATTAPTEGATTTAATTAKEPKYEDYTKEIVYGESSDLEKWLFVETAGEGDAKVIEESSTEVSTNSDGTKKNVNVYKYTAYMVITPKSLNTDLTFNLGYFLTTDKTIADELRGAFLAGDTKTAKALAELGQDKNKELSKEGSELFVSAGSSKTAQSDAFKSSYPEFDAWLNSADRKPGDLSDVIEIKPTKDGAPTYYIVGYFEGLSDPVWRAQAIGAMVGEDMDEWYKGADGKGGQLALTPISKNDRSLKGIDVSKYFLNLAYNMMAGMGA